MASPDTPRTTVADGPGNATIASGKRAIQLASSGVQPPIALYIQPEDSFALSIYTPITIFGSPFNLLLRWLRPDGEIVGIRKQLLVSGTLGVMTFTLGEGWLLSATLAIPTGGTIDFGTIFATLTVQRDTPEANLFHMYLFSDYLTTSHAPTWPYGRALFGQEGPGRVRSITGTTPAAGAEISETVPNNVRWKLLAFRYTLTTAIAAGTRIPRFVLDDGVNQFWNFSNNTGQTASQVVAYNAGPGLPFQNDSNGDFTQTIPNEVFLAAGHRIRTITPALQPADQYSAPQYLVQEWVAA
jgi:hypothetical protein